MKPAPPSGETSLGRRRALDPELLAGGLSCLVLVGLICSRSLGPGSAHVLLARLSTAQQQLLGSGNPRGSWPPVLPASTATKPYYLPAELGVHHFTLLGKLSDGTVVKLHLWLVATRQPATGGANGTITMQGYGMFERADVILVYGGAGMLLMPPAVSQDLERAGLLYLEQRDTGRQHSFGARMNVGSPRSPFHLNCTIPDDVPLSQLALDLRVRGWRRFLELPMDHMLAVSPADLPWGRFRVGVWLTPEMTGPQAARLVALHAGYHVKLLGFHEEQVYMHPHQMAACLRDAAILELVEAAQLKLVYLDGDFPEMFTRCRRLARSGEVNSSVSADEEGCQEDVVKYANQVVVNAHLVLANLGRDAYVLNVDLDEYLVLDNRTTLPELFDGCFRNRTVNLARSQALCTDCEERNATESGLWMDRSRSQHPLAQYQTLFRTSKSRLFERPKWLIKPDDVWSLDVHEAHLFEGRNYTGHQDALACGARLLNVFNMFKQRTSLSRLAGHMVDRGPFTYLWPLQRPDQLQ